MTTAQRKGRPPRVEEAALAWIERDRRGRRGHQSQTHLLPAGASPTTQLVLDFIREYKRREDLYPTFREIREACRLSSTSLAHYHVVLLDRVFGKLTRKAHRYALRRRAA